MEPDSTAKEAWDRLRDIFQDNQNSRAVTLEQEFSNTNMEDFPSVSAYCQRLKSQLKNVGAPADNNRLVLQLVPGLSEPYNGVATLIRQSNPLPHFYQARSMLTLEEASKAKQAAMASAMVASVPRESSNSSGDSRGIRGKNKPHKKSENRKQTGSGGGGRGQSSSDGSQSSGSSGGRSSGGVPGQQQQPWMTPPPWQQFPAYGYQPWGWAPQWAAPPSPYPTQGWARPQGPQKQPGILGPRPQQAFVAQQSNSYGPTDIDSALHTMTLHQPDPSWYMDTGATSHMTSSNGNLSSYFNLSNHHNGIIVGSGHTIPIRGCGHTTLPSPNPPLSLNNVLHAPKLIKNLISVRKFTKDNCVSVEFDPYGFSVKDYRTGSPIMRCDSQGDLYPITSIFSKTSPSTFIALASSICHDRLGHPGSSILKTLSNNKHIECTHSSSSSVCRSCVLGKHVKLPFLSSNSITSMPFDIVHSDLWTSPVLSSSGHRYYMLVLDDYSKFCGLFL
ncbi:uncharacterized protein LOC110710840 [Chenopodium quinoa]|uniref:uncharacterized protein LOC110710840 n=1 Tax=Chenopodium quinoa TaxID=63459 RepID=UPI000B78C6FA|nr:uncharacterized protein LOC110710840 [Chenopodium quinoa]